MAGEDEKKPDEEVKPIIPEDEDVDKPPEGYSTEEWADLSDEEKDGILSEEDEEGKVTLPSDEEELDEEVLKEIVGEEEPEKKEEVKEEAKGAEGERKPEGKVEEAPKKEEAVETKPEGKTAEPTTIISDDELLRFKPFVSESEIKVEEAISPEVQSKLDALDTKYDSGEMTLKEYNAQRDVINRDIIRKQVQQMEGLRQSKIWDKEQAFFFQNRPEYMGKDMKSRALLGAMKESVATLGGDPKYQSVSGMELLLAADKAVKETFGLNKPVEKPKETKPKEEKKVAVKPPAKIPDNKTLTDIPAAAGNQTESPFAAIDKLTGEAYEEAIERLTPAQRAKYEDDADRGVGYAPRLRR